MNEVSVWKRACVLFVFCAATAIALVILGAAGLTASPKVQPSLAGNPSHFRIGFPYSEAAGANVSLLGMSAMSAMQAGSHPVNLFFDAPSFPTGPNVYAIASGDFNHDGKLDLVTTDNTDNGLVYVLLGNGDGTFQAPVSYATLIPPSAVTVGDFNGDGNLDLAVAGESGSSSSVSILLGNGNGTFQIPITFATSTGPNSIATADFNHDGILDLVTVNTYTDSISVLLGLGGGRFGPHQDYSVMQGANSVAVGDFNGDGNLDVVTADYSTGMVSVLLGNGDGTFQPQQTYPAGCGPYHVAVGDFNGDGKLDLAVADGQCNDPNEPNNVSILLGNGDGTFQPLIGYDTAAGATDVSVGDLNGDGKLDLAISNYTGNSVSILLGKGDGTFQPHMDFGTGSYPGALVAGDFNGDHKVDLVTTALPTVKTGAVNVLLGNGDGTFRARRDFSTAPGPTGVVFADFNHDGKLDLAVTTSTSTVLTPSVVGIFLGNGDGTFQPPVEYSTGLLPYSAATGDFNLDGNADLVTANAGNETASVLLGKGDGTFQPAATYAVGRIPVSVAVADFNGDGKPDFAVVNNCGTVVVDCQNPVQGTVTIWLGNGDGTFGGRTDYDVEDWPVSIVVGDFNHDGKIDLAVANFYSDSVSILLGNGDGSFQNQKSYSTGRHTGPYWVATADFNKDGKLDLVTPNVGTNTVSVLLGNGDGTFNPPVQYPVGTGPMAVATGDFNADGNVDLAVATSGGNGLNLLLGNGDGTFQQAMPYDSGQGSYAAIVADFNGDHQPDIVTTNRDSNSISILLDTIGTVVSLTSAPNPSEQGQPVIFTATVAGSIKGQPVPTGKVEFKSGSKRNIVPLANGTATFTTSHLPIGKDKFRASYSGDSNFAPNRSAPIIQNVNP